MHRLDIEQRADLVTIAPGKELHHRPVIGRACAAGRRGQM
jgi:hypothetical protein